MLTNAIYPFVAVVGQEQLKKALQIALVNQKAGGLLIGGEKGTAKSTLVRAAKEIIGTQKIVDLPLMLRKICFLVVSILNMLLVKANADFCLGY